MACILRISGVNLDIDAAVAAVPLSPITKFRKGDRRQTRNATNSSYSYSGLNYLVSDAEMEDFQRQLTEADEYFRKFGNVLVKFKTLPEIEEMNVDFGISMTDEVAAISRTLPNTLLCLISTLGFSVTLSVYITSTDKT